ncbi:unnamed protein product [Prorocentrum cordatum]|uniref:Uncharacterized protein n=1 Tax=Prorocentrum cordatum TaxID=2364126 RepID=A0ABN9WHA8_9DINO|nr:unnamed protein product [Polarella glacialis]
MRPLFRKELRSAFRWRPPSAVRWKKTSRGRPMRMARGLSSGRTCSGPVDAQLKPSMRPRHRECASCLVRWRRKPRESGFSSGRTRSSVTDMWQQPCRRSKYRDHASSVVRRRQKRGESVTSSGKTHSSSINIRKTQKSSRRISLMQARRTMVSNVFATLRTVTRSASFSKERQVERVVVIFTPACRIPNGFSTIGGSSATDTELRWWPPSTAAARRAPRAPSGGAENPRSSEAADVIVHNGERNLQRQGRRGRPSRTAAAWRTSRALAPASGAGSAACPTRACTSGAVRLAARGSQSSKVIS